jgi:hypothetical protein
MCLSARNAFITMPSVVDDNDVYMDDIFFDRFGRFNLSQALPNSDDNPVKKYVYYTI